MKRPRVSLFIMIDALGAQFLRRHAFLPEMEFRGSLRTVLGYSCACEPTLLSGKLPQEHGHGAMFQLRNGDSVLDVARPYQWLPSIIRENHRIRTRLQGRVSRDVEGYFSLYECPVRLLPRFDLVEKKSIFAPGGLRRARSIFDDLQDDGVRWRSYYWNRSEEENLESVRADLREKTAEWILLYLPHLDGLLHRHGLDGEPVMEHLEWYQERVRELLDLAHEGYERVECTIFSDHGMSDVHGAIDILSEVERELGTNGDRYLAFYDSTMARFWCEDPAVRSTLEGILTGRDGGRLIPDEELAELGSRFPDRSQGDLTFLADEGILILPSYMGREMLAGMHGYHPDANYADACFLSLTMPAEPVAHLKDVYFVMARAARRLLEDRT